MSEQGQTPTLPDIPSSTIDRMEDEIFARISMARATDASRQRRRRRTAVGWSAAAAAGVVVAAVAVPAALVTTGTSAGSSGAAVAPGYVAGDTSGIADSSTASGASEGMSGSAREAAAEPVVVTTATIDLQVTDITAAATALAAYADSIGGFVESQSVGTPGMDESATDTSYPSPNYAYIAMRIPADKLTEAQTAIAKDGTVLNSSVSRTDVTATSVDLHARVDSLRASVKRLEEIMAGTGTVADLVAAESALAERQATLESYEQQLEALNTDVTMTSVSVNLSEASNVTANPTGFADGLAAGWHGLIASLNGIIIGIGFALPWLVLIGVVGLVIWLIRRRIRARRAPEFDERA